MSAKARVRLCSGLARLGWLSRRKFRNIFPRANKVKFSGNGFFEIGGALNDEYNDRTTPMEIECDLYAGDVITVKDSSKYPHDADWIMVITYDFGEETVRGMFRADEEGTETWSRFVIPTGGGYYYTKTLQSRFNIPKNNINVGTYPNCRRWAKD